MHDWGYFVRKGTDRQKSTVLASPPEIALSPNPAQLYGTDPVGPFIPLWTSAFHGAPQSDYNSFPTPNYRLNHSV
jgi:hypothetical protein